MRAPLDQSLRGGGSWTGWGRAIASKGVMLHTAAYTSVLSMPQCKYIAANLEGAETPSGCHKLLYSSLTPCEAGMFRNFAVVTPTRRVGQRSDRWTCKDILLPYSSPRTHFTHKSGRRLMQINSQDNSVCELGSQHPNSDYRRRKVSTELSSNLIGGFRAIQHKYFD